MADIERRFIDACWPADGIDVWLPIPGREAYEVSPAGRIRRRISPDLKQRPNKQGYLSVQLSDGKGKPVWISVHRAVALAFIGNQPPKKPHVCHKDGDRTNNHANNLYWGSPKDNGLDKRMHNLERLAKISTGPERAMLDAVVSRMFDVRLKKIANSK
jgi:hypothetical protein